MFVGWLAVTFGYEFYKHTQLTQKKKQKHSVKILFNKIVFYLFRKVFPSGIF